MNDDKEVLTWSKKSELPKSSISLVMVSSPFSPKSSSLRDLLISFVKIFDHGFESFSHSEIRSRKMCAIQYKRKLGSAFFHSSFVDQVPNMRYCREHQASIQCHMQEINVSVLVFAYFNIDTGSGWLVQNDHHLNTNTDQDSVFQGPKQTTSKGCKCRNQVNFWNDKKE